MSNWFYGPGKRQFFITDHAIHRWEERCPHIDLTNFEHAVRFSRFVGEGPMTKEHDFGKMGAILYYKYEKLIFIAKRPIRTDREDCWWIATVYSVPYAPKWFGLNNKQSSLYDDFSWWERKENKESKGFGPGKDWLKWYYSQVNKGGRKAYGIIEAIREQTLQA